MANITKKQLMEKVAELEAENKRLLGTVEKARIEYKKLIDEYNAVVKRLNDAIAFFKKGRKRITKKAA